jgi:serine/threonine protein kinase
MSVPYGAYGLILPPQSIQGIDPTHVTKVFHTKEKYDNFLEKMGMIREIFQGDPSYLVYPFDRDPTLSNVPNQYKHTVSYWIDRNMTRHKKNEKVEPLQQPIYAVHMPHLGVDLTHVKEILRHLLAIPAPIMLTNMYKLLEKVEMLWNHGYVHGDVRPPNIMIQPETGKLTLIDFDFLMEVREFAKVYRPVMEKTERSMMGNGKTKKVLIAQLHIPPELLLSDISQSGMSQDQNTSSVDLSYKRFGFNTKTSFANKDTHSKTHRTINNYCKQFRQIFTHMDPNLHRLCESKLQTAMEDSITYWNELLKEGRSPIMESYRTLDGYGIGQNLLELFHQLYPGSITYDREPSSIYPSQRAIYQMINKVLKPMCALSLRNRMHVSDALKETSKIIAELYQRVAPAHVAPANVAPANEAPENNAVKAPAHEAPANEKPAHAANEAPANEKPANAANEKPANEKPTNGAAPANNVKSANQGNKQGGTRRLKRSTKRTTHTKARRHNIARR